MPKIDESVYIARAPEDVFAYVSDFDNDAVWQSGVDESAWIDDRETGVGRRARSVGRFLGKRMEFTVEVTAWDPPKQASIKTVEGPFPYHGTYRCEAEGDGCRFSFLGEAESLGGFFGKLGDPIVVKMYGRQVRSDLENLKEILESELEGQLKADS